VPFSALLDACVLFPVGVRDTLLSVAETEVYRVLWSEQILAEAHGAIVRRYESIDVAKLDATFADIREAFPDAAVPGYEDLIGGMTNHPGDRHVLAAAVAGGAQVIVTDNLSHFPQASCKPYGSTCRRPTSSWLTPSSSGPSRSSPPSRIKQPSAGAHVDPSEPWLQALDLSDVDIGTQTS
jgi:predicted nucleic acid-binding protein